MFRMRGDAQKVFEALYCMFWVYISHSVIVKLNLFALFATTFKSNNDTKCDRGDTLITYIVRTALWLKILYKEYRILINLDIYQNRGIAYLL